MLNNLVTLIIVDPENKIYTDLESILDNNYLTVRAKSGREAISLSEKIKPDLILVDLNLPDIDGISLCKELNTKREIEEIPLIFLSDSKNHQIGIECFKTGGVDLIFKSIPLEIIVAKINNYISLYNYKKEALRLNQVIEQSPETILITNTAGEIEYVNPRFIQLTGYNPAEVIGNNPRFLKSGYHSEEFYSDLWETISSGKKWHGEIFNRKADGGFFWEETSISPIKNSKGEISKYIAIKYDITEKKEAENKLKEYSQKIESLYKRLDNEFKKGIKLHQHFLPKELPEVEGFNYEVYFQPAERLGGDFYNTIKIGDYLLIYLADVSGHGLDGSMLNIFLRETINNYISSEVNGDPGQSPDKLLKYIIKRYHQEDFSKDYMVCLLIGLLDIEKREFSFVNAGIQVPPVIIRENGTLSTLENSGAPISTSIDLEFYDQTLNHELENFKLLPGDKLLLTTDGLIEGTSVQANSDIPEMYGEERLHNILLKFHKLDSKKVIEKIKEDFIEYTGNEIGHDDITYMVIGGKKNSNPIEVK